MQFVKFLTLQQHTQPEKIKHAVEAAFVLFPQKPVLHETRRLWSYGLCKVSIFFNV